MNTFFANCDFVNLKYITWITVNCNVHFLSSCFEMMCIVKSTIQILNVNWMAIFPWSCCGAFCKRGIHWCLVLWILPSPFCKHLYISLQALVLCSLICKALRRESSRPDPEECLDVLTLVKVCLKYLFILFKVWGRQRAPIRVPNQTIKLRHCWEIACQMLLIAVVNQLNWALMIVSVHHVCWLVSAGDIFYTQLWK